MADLKLHEMSLYYLKRIEALERDKAILAIARLRVEKELEAAKEEIAMLKSKKDRYSRRSLKHG